MEARLVVFTADLGYTVRAGIAAIDAALPGASWLVLVHAPRRTVPRLVRNQWRQLRRNGLRYVPAFAAEVAQRLAPPRPGRIPDDAPGRYASLAPTLVLLVLLTVVPVVYLVAMSLHTIVWQGGGARWTFVGLANYLAMPGNVFFSAALRNTIVFVAIAVAFEMLLGFALALMVSRLVRGRAAFVAVFLLPILVPAIVIGAIFKLMYNYDFGLINDLVGLVGLAPRDWLGDPNLALASVIVVVIWHWT